MLDRVISFHAAVTVATTTASAVVDANSIVSRMNYLCSILSSLRVHRPDSLAGM